MAASALWFAGAGSGDDFVYTMPNAVGAGNCIVFMISYQHGVSPTISDNNGNTWGAAAKTQDGGTLTDGSQAGASIFVLPNANAGLTQFKAHFGATVSVIDYEIAEFCNVATSSPVDVTVAAGNVTGPNLACGSFTPNINGDLIVCYFSLFTTFATKPTGWVPGGSFVSMNGDVSDSHRPHASQYFVQPTAGAINPGITSTGTTDSFNCVAVALKSASAGVPKPAAGSHKIWIDHLFHITEGGVPPNPFILKFPVTGNCLVLLSGLATQITGITDSQGGSWNKITSGSNLAELWYSQNRTPTANLTLTISNAGQYSYRLYDISNADPSAFDTSGAAFGGCTGVSSISNAPTIIPGITNGLVIYHMTLGQGPAFAITSPAGSIQDHALYTGETDIDTLENADGLGHLFFTSSPGTINVGWNIKNVGSPPGNNFGAVAISLKAA